MLSIKNNLMAENAARHLSRSYDSLAESIERLSSGMRINSAKDDAAGLAVRELIRADVATLKQGARNARDAVSMIQTAEGAMGVIDDILVRMKELAEQASTESYSTNQRQIMDAEFSQLMSEIDRIAANTAFNDLKLLDATTETLNIHLGTSEMIAVGTSDMTSAGLALGAVKSNSTWKTWVSSPTANWCTGTTAGDLTFTFAGQNNIMISLATQAYTMDAVAGMINSASRALTEAYDAAEVVYDDGTGMYSLNVSSKAGGAANDLTIAGDGTLVTDILVETQANWNITNGSGTAYDITTAPNAQTALGKVQDAIKTKDNYRAKLGYLMNRLEAAISVIDIQAENLMAAESRISDVDVATEMANMTRTQVLSQAGISMLAQANMMPQMALNLLG